MPASIDDGTKRGWGEADEPKPETQSFNWGSGDMKRKLIFAATLLSFAGVLAPYADEVTDLKAEAKALQRQNEALNKRLAAIEQRQKAMDVNLAASRQRALDANAAGVISTKAVPYTSTDDFRGAGTASVCTVLSIWGSGREAHGMLIQRLNAHWRPVHGRQVQQSSDVEGVAERPDPVVRRPHG